MANDDRAPIAPPPAVAAPELPDEDLDVELGDLEPAPTPVDPPLPEGAAWSSEVDAWGASLPIAIEPPDQQAAELVRPETPAPQPGIEESLDQLVNAFIEEPTAKAEAAALAPMIEAEVETSRARDSVDAAVRSREPGEPPRRPVLAPDIDGSGALVIPDLDVLEAVTTGVTAAVVAPPGAPSSSPADAARPSATSHPRRWAAAPESAIHFSWNEPGASARDSLPGASLPGSNDDGLPDLPDLPPLPGEGAGPLVDPFDGEPPADGPAPLPTPAPADAAPDAWLAPFDFEASAAGARPERGYWRDELARCMDEVSTALAAADFALGAHMAVAAARIARRLGMAETGIKLCEEALGYVPHHAPALRERWLLAYAAGRPEDIERSLVALAEAGPAPERPAYASLLRELRAARGWQEHHPAEAEAEPRGTPPNDDDEGVSASLIHAETRLRVGDRTAAAHGLSTAGRRIGGAAGADLLMMAARLVEFQGDAASGAQLAREADQLDPAHPGTLWGTVRQAARAPAADALAMLEPLVDGMAPSLSRAAIARWAARLARSVGDGSRSKGLLLRGLDGQPSSTWDLEDHLILQTGAQVLLDGGEGSESLGPGDGAVLRSAMAASLVAEGQHGPALTVVAEGLAAEPDALPLALAAERMARTASDQSVRDAAFELWADHDPARRSHAHLLRWRFAAPGAAGEVERTNRLRSVVQADPLDPAFWSLAWAELEGHRHARAATALEAGASAWESAGAETIVAALRERAADLRLAQAPAHAVARALASSARSEMLPDHPRTLAVTLLERGTDPAAVAAAFRAAALASPESARRTWEAASWLLEAGDRGGAAHVLLARAAAGELDEPGAILLRRLLPGSRDPVLTRVILSRLEERAGTEGERSVLAFRRAEALESGGAGGEAIEVYRQLLSGPLRPEADIALRRLLWTAPDAHALDSYFRDEIDAHLGAGQDRPAAAALVERARIRADLFDDASGARELLSEALARDPGQLEARLVLLIEDARSDDHQAVFRALLAMADAADEPRARHRVWHLAAMVDEGRNAGQAMNGMLPRPNDGPDVPLALAFRSFAEAGGLGGTGQAVAAWCERLATRLAAVPGADARTVGTLLLRGAEAHAGLGNRDEADRLARAALDRDPQSLPALAFLHDSMASRGAWREAADALSRQADVALIPSHRAQALVAAAGLMADKLDDQSAAEALLRRAVDAEPASDQAFAKLRALLERRNDASALSDLLASRLKASPSREEAAALRLARTDLMSGPLRDRPGAKAELRSILLDDSQHLVALGRLAALEFEDGAYAVAAELYIRLARFEREPNALRDIFLRIGRIYHKRLADPKLATGAFERVLRLEASNREALDALSELYTKQGDVRRALLVTDQALGLETDGTKRLTLLLRAADLQEKAGEPRRAASLLRRAVDEHPRSLQAVGELARFYERTREVQGRNVLLDSAIALARDDLRRDPGELTALRTIVPLLRWRQRAACSTAAAQMIGALSDDPAERREAASWAAPPAKGRRLTPLANPELDERAHATGLLAGARHLLRLAGPSLGRALRPDLKRWGVGRSDRLDVGEGARALIDPLAVDLGVRGFEVYASRTVPQALAVEPGDPPALIIGADLLAMGPSAVRFAAGFGLRLLATHFDLVVAHGPVRGAALLAGLIRQSVPEYDHADLPDADVQAASTLVARALPKSLKAELSPFAMEIAFNFPIEPLFEGVLQTASRVGLLACGDLGMALRVLLNVHAPSEPQTQPVDLGGRLDLARLRRTPIALALFDFALSADHDDLVRALESVA